MGDHDDGKADLLPEVTQYKPQLLAGERIQRSERLVQHQQRRVMNERAAERSALLHAARQFPGVALAESIEPYSLEERQRLRPVLRLLLPESPAMRLYDLQRQQDIVDDLAPWQQIRILKSHPCNLHRAAHLVAENDDVTRIRSQEPGHELHQRRLAAAGRTNHRGKLATSDGQRSTFKREHPARGAAVGQRDVGNVDGAGHTAATARAIACELSGAASSAIPPPKRGRSATPDLIGGSRVGVNLRTR